MMILTMQCKAHHFELFGMTDTKPDTHCDNCALKAGAKKGDKPPWRILRFSYAVGDREFWSNWPLASLAPLAPFGS